MVERERYNNEKYGTGVGAYQAHVSAVPKLTSGSLLCLVGLKPQGLVHRPWLSGRVHGFLLGWFIKL